jgi:hypothetical protein
MVPIRRNPRVILSLCYQAFDQLGHGRMQGGSVRLPSLSPEGDDAAGEIHIIAKVYPSFCDATALVPGNLKGCVKHIAQNVALHAFNFLSDEFDVHLRQFRFTLRFVLADTESDGWVSLYETTVQSFVKDDPKYVNLIKCGIVTRLAEGQLWMILTSPSNVIEAMRACDAFYAPDFVRLQEKTKNLPCGAIPGQRSLTVPVTHLEPVIDPSPSGAARFMIEATNLLSRKFRFQSKSLANFNWIFGRMPKAGGKGTAMAAGISVRNPEIGRVGTFVEVSHKEKT